VKFEAAVNRALIRLVEAREWRIGVADVDLAQPLPIRRIVLRRVGGGLQRKVGEAWADEVGELPGDAPLREEGG
jgi:hypothetical protein